MDENRKPIREKKHRLWNELYTGEQVVAFTGNVKNREPLFEDVSVFKNIEQLLLESLQKHKCDAYVYLFMPDHFHFILIGKDSNSNIK